MMNDDQGHESLSKPEQPSMPLAKKKSLLRALLRARYLCPRCVVVSPGRDIEPCYSCINLPRESRKPFMTTN